MIQFILNNMSLYDGFFGQYRQFFYQYSLQEINTRLPEFNN